MDRARLKYLIFFGFCLILVGCSKSPTSESKPNSISSVERKQISVAAASDLRFAMQEVQTEFERLHPDHTLQVVFGSSGQFYSQISAGAPFDLFLSADASYPERLVDAKLAKSEDVFPYAIGHLVVWVLKESPLEIEKGGLEYLTGQTVQRIAIANPQNAPYGRAAVAALKKADLYETIEKKLVSADNVSQAAQFVESGAADVGLIAQSLALSETMQKQGRMQPVDSNLHPPIQQVGVVLAEGKNRDGAKLLQEWLTSEAGQKLLERFGFSTSEE